MKHIQRERYLNVVQAMKRIEFLARKGASRLELAEEARRTLWAELQSGFVTEDELKNMSLDFPSEDQS